MKNFRKLYVIIALTQLLVFIPACNKDDTDAPATAIKDADGNVYSSVTIGTQTWLKENLMTTKYLNGDLIGTTTPSDLDITSELTAEYQWAYEGNEGNVSTYGRLYTWYAATDSRKVCPAGWHVPTDDEWTTLTTYLGGEGIAGGKLKETGTIHWSDPNTGATNETNFTAVPTGDRFYNGVFEGVGIRSNMWSSTEQNPINGYVRSVVYINTECIKTFPVNKRCGLPVRCIKD